MISVPMSRHDGVQRSIGDDLQKSIIVVGGVDQQGVSPLLLCRM